MLSIIIVNWNTREFLKKCLASIYQFPPDCDFEIIVVDNASQDSSAEMVRTDFPSVKLLEPGSNLGYADGNNLGFSEAQGDFLLTLNPDTEFIDYAIRNCISILREKPNVGVLGPQLIGPDNKSQKSIRGFPSVLGILGSVLRLDKILKTGPFSTYSLPLFDYSKDGFADQPMGTFLLFRRSALETVGDPKKPFDSQFPIFFNEVDLLFRLKNAGWPCWYSSKEHVLHHHGASTKQVPKKMIWESHKSLSKYFAKHLKGLRRIWLPGIIFLNIVVAFIRARGYHAGFRTDHHDL